MKTIVASGQARRASSIVAVIALNTSSAGAGTVVSTAVENHDVGLVYGCQVGDAFDEGR